MNTATLDIEKAIASATTKEELKALEELLIKGGESKLKKRPYLGYIPNNNQRPFHESAANERWIFAGNRSGKTCGFVMEFIWHMTGDYPSWYPEEGKSPKPPIKGRYGCTDLTNALNETILPEFKKWLGVRLKNFSEKYHTLEIDNGSTLKLMSYDSYDHDPDSWESVSLHIAGLDEHPPKGAYQATRSRLSLGRGRMWNGLTPANTRASYWEFEDIFEEAGRRPGLAVFRGNTYANKDNLGEGYIDRLTIGLDEQEKQVRLYGDFIVLTGLIYKILKKSKIFFVDDFNVSGKEWTHYCGIDPHDRTPTAVGWCAVNGLGDIYWHKCLFNETEGMTVKQISQLILDTEKELGITVERRIIDPASEQGINAEQPDMNLRKMFAQNGIYTQLGYNDILSGHARVRELLYFDLDKPVDLNNRPKMYFFKEGFREGIYQLKHYVHDEYRFHAEDRDPKEKPKDKCKHLPDCYDSETEILTEMGWVKFINLKPNVSVATLRHDNFLEFQKPMDYIREKYKGKMIRINSKAADLLITLNHRMMVYPQAETWQFRMAHLLQPQDRIPVSSKGIKYGKCEPFIWNGEKVDAEDWAEFMGWYISEGSATGTKGGKIQTPGRGYSIYVSQSLQANPENCKKINELLRKMPFNFRYNGRHFVISSKVLWSYLFPLGNSYQKYIPEDIKNLSPKCLQRLWDSLVKGDGWIHKGTETYSTVSFRLINDISEILSKMGYANNVTMRMPEDMPISSVNGKIIKPTVKQYYITKHRNDKAAISDSERNKRFRLDDYDGEVFCVTVPNHTLLVRRNFKTVFSGNCVRYVTMANPYFVPHETKFMEFDGEARFDQYTGRRIR